MEASKLAAAGRPRLNAERKKFYKVRTPDQLATDVSNLANQQYDLSGRLRREREAAEKQLGWADLKIWILTGVAVAQFAIIGWGVTRLLELFELVKK